MSQIGDDPRTEDLRWREKLRQDEERARQRANARRDAGESVSVAHIAAVHPHALLVPP